MSEETTVFDYIKNYPLQRTWEEILIHHSATPDGATYDTAAIKNYHVNTKGWNDIGYHFLLEFMNGRLSYVIGRGMNDDGAHTIGRNKQAIGICVVGNFDIIEPSHQHYFLTACLCREIMRKCSIPAWKVNPHWAYADKSCPGKMFNTVKLRYEYIEKCIKENAA